MTPNNSTTPNKKIPVSNDAQLFFGLVKAKIIGIRVRGKTTTTTLVGEIADQENQRPKGMDRRKYWKSDKLHDSKNGLLRTGSLWNYPVSSLINGLHPVYRGCAQYYAQPS